MLLEKISNNDHIWRKVLEVEISEEVMNIIDQREEESAKEGTEEEESEDELGTTNVEEIMREGVSEQLLAIRLNEIYQIDGNKLCEESASQLGDFPSKMIPSTFKPQMLELKSLFRI